MNRFENQNHSHLWRVFLLGAALVALSQRPARAQQPEGAQKKIESLKSQYLTRQMELSPEEARKFWPVYREYQQQMDALARKRRQNQRARSQMDHPSDAEIDQSLDRDFKLQQQALQLREQYRQRFRQIIPSQKVMQFYKSEKDFNMKLVRELQRRSNNDGNTPSRNNQERIRTTSPQRSRTRTPSRATPVRTQPGRNIRSNKSTPPRSNRSAPARSSNRSTNVRGR